MTGLTPMINISGLEIPVTIEQLLLDLQMSLQVNGISLLHTIKPVGNNIMISCPSHKDGQERKPSCGVSIVDTYSGNKLIPTGTVHCFTCGYTATLLEFISHCFGYKDGGRFGSKWVKTNYRTSLATKDRTFELNIARTKEKKEITVVPESILDSYRYTVPYMYDRGLTDEIIELFDIGYDKANRCITIPVKNLKGQVEWVQTRNIDYKKYEIPSGIVKTDYILGAYECMHHRPGQEVYITESPFNMFTLWTLGFKGICLFGTGGGNQYKILRQLPFRHYILALDNDDAGLKGKERLITQLTHTKLLDEVIYEDNRDINELGVEFLFNQYKSINF